MAEVPPREGEWDHEGHFRPVRVCPCTGVVSPFPESPRRFNVLSTRNKVGSWTETPSLLHLPPSAVRRTELELLQLQVLLILQNKTSNRSGRDSNFPLTRRNRPLLFQIPSCQGGNLTLDDLGIPHPLSTFSPETSPCPGGICSPKVSRRADQSPGNCT